MGLMDFFTPAAGQKRRNWLDSQLGGMWEYVPPELRPFVALGNEMNPVTSIERAGQDARRVVAPNVSGWDRMAAAGDMASNMAGVVAPAVAASKGAVPAVQAAEDALMGWSASSPMAFAARDFATDEFGGVRLDFGDRYVKAYVDDVYAGEANIARGGPFLSSINVEPQFRGRGVGRELYSAADEIAGGLVPSPLGLTEDAARIWKKRLAEMPRDQAQAILDRAAEIGRGYGIKEADIAERFAGLLPSNPNTPGFRAYHGSPHDFDRFSLDKIGTGEGAQAYGHGLYFAESEGVARSYRDALTNPVDYRGQGYPGADSNLAAKKVADAMGPNSNPANVIASEANKFRYQAQQMRAALSGQSGAAREANERLAASFERIAADIERLNPDDFRVNTGRMYEVQINADPNDFLDWDKPLSEQPKAVRDAFAGMGRDYEALGDTRFIGVNPDRIQYDAGSYPSGLIKNAGDRGQVEAELRARGIPGIRYLDAGSRGAGDGSRNYVVFDDKLIEILRKYGLVPGMIGAGAYGMQPTEAQAGQ